MVGDLLHICAVRLAEERPKKSLHKSLKWKGKRVDKVQERVNKGQKWA